MPEDELIRKTLEFWQKTIALTFAIDVNHIPNRRWTTKEILQALKNIESAMENLEQDIR